MNKAKGCRTTRAKRTDKVIFRVVSKIKTKALQNCKAFIYVKPKRQAKALV